MQTPGHAYQLSEDLRPLPRCPAAVLRGRRTARRPTRPRPQPLAPGHPAGDRDRPRRGSDPGMAGLRRLPDPRHLRHGGARPTQARPGCTRWPAPCASTARARATCSRSRSSASSRSAGCDSTSCPALLTCSASCSPTVTVPRGSARRHRGVTGPAGHPDPRAAAPGHDRRRAFTRADAALVRARAAAVRERPGVRPRCPQCTAAGLGPDQAAVAARPSRRVRTAGTWTSTSSAREPRLLPGVRRGRAALARRPSPVRGGRRVQLQRDGDGRRDLAARQRDLRRDPALRRQDAAGAPVADGGALRSGPLPGLHRLLVQRGRADLPGRQLRGAGGDAAGRRLPHDPRVQRRAGVHDPERPPVQFHISCIVTLPNVSVTLYLPVDIFDRDVLPRMG